VTSTQQKGQKEIRFAYYEYEDEDDEKEKKINYVDIPARISTKKFRGTVFLDEIDSIPLELQSKLLTIILSKQVVISDKTFPYSAKVICASNKNILNDNEGTIVRRDLFYRVARGVVQIPSLREMPESIPDMAEHLIAEDPMNSGVHFEAILSGAAKELLTEYEWPGNVRELENVLYQALKSVQIENTDTIEPRHLKFSLNKPGKSYKIIKRISEKKYDEALNLFNRQYMKELYQKSKGNKTEAGRIAGIDRNKVDRMWKELEII